MLRGSFGKGSDGGRLSASLGKLKPGEKFGSVGTVKPQRLATGGPAAKGSLVVLVCGGGWSTGGGEPMTGGYHGIREA